MVSEQPMENMIITGSYDWPLVVLSYVIATVAAYVALNFVASFGNSRNSAGKVTITMGALSLGTGIWVMHFIGMLAYQLPVAMSFDPAITFFSYVIAVAASWLALYVATSGAITHLRFVVSAILFCCAMVSMHYVGMYAIRLPAEMTYRMEMLVVPVGVALAASFFALYLLFYVQKKGKNGFRLKIASAIVIGFGVTGMHYTGMEAMQLQLVPSLQGMETGALDHNLMAIGTVMLTVCLIGFNVVLPLINDKKVGRERVAFMILTMTTTTTIIVLSAIGFLYNATYKQYQNHLSDIAKSNASLINAVARFDKQYSADAHEDGAIAATIGQVKDAIRGTDILSYNADMMLVSDSKENIRIVISGLHHDKHGEQLINKTEYSKKNPLAFPFVQALSGKSGMMVIDNIVSGERTMISYEPVKELGFAFVVETHMDDIWAPFRHALILTLFISIAVIFVGSWFIHAINMPVIRKLQKEIENRMEAQDELHQINLTLEDRVRERTEELEATNTKLAEEAREREHVEIALRENYQFQEKILDSTTNAIFVLSYKCNMGRVNPMLSKLTGYEYKELIYNNFFKLLHPDSIKGITQAINNVKEKGEAVHNHEAILIKKDGEEAIVLVSFAPMYENGEVVSIVGTMDDITEQRKVMDALVLAKENAEYANKSKSEFLANMSHEIRTPMNGVLGMLSMLKDSKMNREQEDYVKTAIDSGEALLAILNDILDLSKIESGKLEFERAEFNLHSVIEDSATLFAEKAHNKGVELAVYIAKSVPEAVFGDQTRLRQILMNLLSNAIKFTEKGEVVISVEGVSFNSKSQLLFKIKDTGVGITQEQQDKIFDSFTQADGSTTRKFGGTGLGLTICRQLINLMGGEIGIESEPEKGSTFWFKIILEKGTGNIHQFSTNHEFKKLKALIVDDNHTNRAILEYQLKNWGIKYESVQNASSALDKYQQALKNKTPFDLLLVDYMMPGKNGIDMIKDIKKNAKDNNPLIIMLSSAMAEGVREKAEDAGIHRYLNKPVRQSYLYDSILELVHENRKPITARATRQKETSSVDVSADPKAINKIKLLVAEDNVINQKVITGMLKKLGYQARVTSNGAEAFQELQNQDYDIVLMDCQMPEMDGFAATRAIRQLDSTKSQIPIIAMTANAMQGDREKCIDSGMDDYLAKPLSIEGLRTILEKYTSGRECIKEAEKCEIINI